MSRVPDRTVQLERIARLLGRSVQSFGVEDAGAAILGELLAVWARLDGADRRDVLALAKDRAVLRDADLPGEPGT